DGNAVLISSADLPTLAPSEKQVYSLNKRIQAQNRTPEDFPGFVRTGFDVKVVGDGYSVTPSGLFYKDFNSGQGPLPIDGQEVVFQYTGYNESGAVIDTSYRKNRPAQTRLGIAGLIPGFEEGIRGMKAGQQRRIVIPPALGPPVGPSTFFSAKQCEVFDIELIAIKTCERRQLAMFSDVAEVQRLRDVEQLLMGTADGLQGDLDDLQAAHQRLQDEHAALQQVASKTRATNHSLRAAQRSLQCQVHNYLHKRRPHHSPLTFKQRQQLLVLEQHPVSVEVLRRCAEAGYGRLDSHGRPMGSMAEQLSPAGLAPLPTDIFIPTQEGLVGRPAARTAPFNAHHCLSTVRLHLETLRVTAAVTPQHLPEGWEQSPCGGAGARAGAGAAAGAGAGAAAGAGAGATDGAADGAAAAADGAAAAADGAADGAGAEAGAGAGRLTTQVTDVLAIIPLPIGTAEAHVQVIMQELLLHGLDSACIASITADSAAVNMGEYGGVVTRMSKLLQSKGQAGCIRAQPCYSHGIHNTLLAGLAALGGDIRPAIESIASLLAQYWVPLGMGAWGAKPQVPCDTRWASYISSTVTMLRVWAHARDAVSQLLERQKGMSPPWAVTLSQLLQDNSLLLRLGVVAVVGESFLVPELMWASKDDGLHAFELYRHTQDVLARLGTWDTLPLLAGLHSQLQHLVPVDQREQQKQQLATYLQEHCGAMWTYYQHHVQAQMALPHLFAALGSSDQATRMEVAIDVVYHAELRLPPPEDGQQQQQQQQQQRMQQQQQQEDPYGTWRQYASDIRAMAVNGDPGSPALRLHLEQYYLACPISNAPVESLLQLLKHGSGRYMELPALLQLMSLRTCKEALKTVDVNDLQQHMGQLRAEVRRKEDAAAAAQRSAKAERLITDAAHKVGRVVINVGDHACQERLAAAHALAFGGRDYGHTTVEEAMKMTGKQLQSYLQFHKQEL
ncbi:hypothetical protein QJQ45_024007, partial [Haematococcus lacustris]